MLGVPCITLRHNTERPITCVEGTNRLVGSGKEDILAAARQVLDGTTIARPVPEKWDGKAAERIVAVLRLSHPHSIHVSAGTGVVPERQAVSPK